jgi:hypothetical protein
MPYSPIFLPVKILPTASVTAAGDEVNRRVQLLIENMGLRDCKTAIPTVIRRAAAKSGGSTRSGARTGYFIA